MNNEKWSRAAARVGPRVIRTLNRGTITAIVFNQTTATMSADIKESMNFSALVSNNDQRFAINPLDDVVASVGDLT